MSRNTYILKEPFEIYQGFTPDDEPEVWIWWYRGKKVKFDKCGKSPSETQAKLDAKAWLEHNLKVASEMNALVYAVHPTIRNQ